MSVQEKIITVVPWNPFVSPVPQRLHKEKNKNKEQLIGTTSRKETNTGKHKKVVLYKGVSMFIVIKDLILPAPNGGKL